MSSISFSMGLPHVLGGNAVGVRAIQVAGKEVHRARRAVGGTAAALDPVEAPARPIATRSVLAPEQPLQHRLATGRRSARRNGIELLLYGWRHVFWEERAGLREANESHRHLTTDPGQLPRDHRDEM